MEELQKTVWSIGHSTRTLEAFTALLNNFNIDLLADIRTFPGSRRYPHFNKESLAASLRDRGIAYVHMVELGGRRKPLENSVNTAWRHASFRGYADYMQTQVFKGAVEKLERLASTHHLAYMCSEALWWKCHRSLVSDHLKVNGWKVLHIMEEGKSTEHPFASPARSVQGKLFY